MVAEGYMSNTKQERHSRETILITIVIIMMRE